MRTEVHLQVAVEDGVELARAVQVRLKHAHGDGRLGEALLQREEIARHLERAVAVHAADVARVHAEQRAQQRRRLVVDVAEARRWQATQQGVLGREQVLGQRGDVRIRLDRLALRRIRPLRKVKKGTVSEHNQREGIARKRAGCKRTTRKRTARKRTARKRTARKRTARKRAVYKRTARKRTARKRTAPKHTAIRVCEPLCFHVIPQPNPPYS